MLERLAENEYYCFLDGFSGYFQIPIDPKDQEKTTFMCPHGTFTYRRMPFGLCNAPGTFQRCMMAIFHDMIKKTMKVFMDDFSENSHFIVKEGIVLGHKISKNGIELDKAKVDVIVKLPHPTTIKVSLLFLTLSLFEITLSDNNLKKIPILEFSTSGIRAWRETLSLGEFPSIHISLSLDNSQKEMDHQYLTVAKIPILDTGKFEQWQFRIQQYLQHEHYAMWEVIEFDDSYKVPTTDPNNTTTMGGDAGMKSRRTVTITTEDM
nr:reverse transcriptase domain-containing protein [Tanacetum cinerariifolium]